jgi:hypothetical protein
MGASASISQDYEYNIDEIKEILTKIDPNAVWTENEEKLFNDIVSNKAISSLSRGLTKDELKTYFPNYFNENNSNSKDIKDNKKSSNPDKAAVVIQARVRGVKTREKSKTTNKNKTSKTIEISSLPSTAKRCVSLSFLIRFTNHFQLWNKLTSEVVREVIVPITSDRKVVWTDLDTNESLLHDGDIGPPQIFISHAWMNKWSLLVLGIKSYADTNNINYNKLLCWIDIFVINQHNYMSELKQLDDVIKICANFIQIIDTSLAIPLGRVWCLYEVMARIRTCNKKNGGIVVIVGEIIPTSSESNVIVSDEISHATTSESQLKDSNDSGTSAHSNNNISSNHTDINTFPVELQLATQQQISKLFTSVNMENSNATVLADRNMIFKQVHDTIKGGFVTVNTQIQNALASSACMSTFISMSDGNKNTNHNKIKHKDIQSNRIGNMYADL